MKPGFVGSEVSRYAKTIDIHFCFIDYCILGCFVQKMSDKDKADRMPGGRADTAVVLLVVDIVTVLGRAQ